MIRHLLAAVATLAIATAAHADDVGKRFPSEKRIILDRVTGRPLTVLTSGAKSDAKLYPTHAQWAQDAQHIIFRSSDRAASGSGQAFAVNELTGDITQLTDGEGTGTGSLNVARLSNKIYYMRRTGEGDDQVSRLIEVDLTPLLTDAAAGKMKPEGYERVVGTFPKGHREAGGFSIDADEKTAYVGFDSKQAPRREPGSPVPQVPGGLRAMDIATGAVRTIITTPFRMGHVQASPFVPGEIMYCHETGGDAPQRMWIVKADGTGNRKLYPEAPWDWVTHEQFADKDHVIFNLMGHRPELREHPTGVAVVNLRDGSVELLGQSEGANARGAPTINPTTGQPRRPSMGGYWHNGVTFDGRFATADDFDGNVTLFDRKSGKRTIVSTGHRMQPDHAHPSFSPDNARVLVQSGMLTDGARLALMTIPVGDEVAK